MFEGAVLLGARKDPVHGAADYKRAQGQETAGSKQPLPETQPVGATANRTTFALLAVTTAVIKASMFRGVQS